MSKRHLEGKTKQERKEIRSKLGSLKDLTVQPATRARYDRALAKFFTYLEDRGVSLPKQFKALDQVVCDYVEELWSEGEGRALASDTLAAIQDSQPQARGHLTGSWRLLKTWNCNELPSRAPPLPMDLLEAMVGYALFKQEPLFALSLLVAFHGMLRTGELLGLTKRHFSIGKSGGTVLVSLGLTKGGRRQGAAESVTLHIADIHRRVQQWIEDPTTGNSLTGKGPAWRSMFASTLKALGFEEFSFRPKGRRHFLV